jgi:hypothetical protein
MYLVYIALLTCVFCLGSVYFKTPDKRAFIISISYSLSLSCAGLWKLYYLIFEAKGSVSNEVMYSYDFVSLQACKLFICGNVLDLVFGSFFYPNYLDLIFAWIHHLFYIVIMFFIIGDGAASLFAFLFVVEVPTFIKALGTIFPNLRSDIMFGITFFAFRIVFHAYYSYQLIMNDYQHVYWKISCLVLLIHSYWMYLWILGMKRRILKKNSLIHKE